jgi:hypothetical protein
MGGGATSQFIVSVLPLLRQRADAYKSDVQGLLLDCGGVYGYVTRALVATILFI